MEKLMNGRMSIENNYTYEMSMIVDVYWRSIDYLAQFSLTRDSLETFPTIIPNVNFSIVSIRESIARSTCNLLHAFPRAG